MNAYTVTAKGQITLRKDLLKHLGVSPGERIDIEQLPGGEIRIKAARPSGKISDAFGMLRKEGRKALSIEEMTEIAAKGWAGAL